jgi:hypothetical protein
MIKLLNKRNMRTLIISVLICLLTFSGKGNPGIGDLVLLQSLKGSWLFSIGINEEWISPKFNDSEWESIKVPSPWEDQGFNGYNGYAFYRKNITIPSLYKGRMLYLNMGYIDDVDEVYLNGHKIGSTGSFPPDYSTAYNAERVYFIPEEYISFDASNFIAVKVFDSYDRGGIVSGEPGLYGGKTTINFDVNLQGTWKFQPGDDSRRKESDFNDSMWNEIFVPAKWEDQKYRNYDGYAWYRKSFICPANYADEKMVVMMGKIDDIDQVFINGTFVGSTGNFPEKGRESANSSQEYNAFRGYYIPAGVLKKGQKNVITVRVLDTGGAGGIYEGPVGILTQVKYIEYWRTLKKSGY